jgi:hypothetical protein
MNSTPQIEALVLRVVAVIAAFLLRNEGSQSYDQLSEVEIDRVHKAYSWMKNTLSDRGRDALLDLEREPRSEDNKADLRKQLTKLLETDPSAVKYLSDIIPDSYLKSSVDIGKVVHALTMGSIEIGIFGHGSGDKPTD